MTRALAQPTAIASPCFIAYEGPTYIDEAFKRARAADPNAVLYYNDFNTEANGDKTTALVNLVQRLLITTYPSAALVSKCTY